MLGKSLIQFSVDGPDCVLSLLFGLRPNYGGGNEDNGDLLQQALLHSVPPTLQQATSIPRLHQRLLDAQGQVWLSLLWCHCSFLLGPSAQVLFVPSKSPFPQSCVSSAGSVVGLMATSTKRAYATPRSAAPRAPAPWQATADPRLHQRHMDTHGQDWVSLLWGHCSFLLGPDAYKLLFVPSQSLFPQSCVSSVGSMVGLMATSTKRAYAIPWSTAPRAPAPAAVHW